MAVAPRPSGSPGPGRSFAPRRPAARTADRLRCNAAVEVCSACTGPAVLGPFPGGAADAGPTRATARPSPAATPTKIRCRAVCEVPEVMFAHLLHPKDGSGVPIENGWNPTPFPLEGRPTGALPSAVCVRTLTF